MPWKLVENFDAWVDDTVIMSPVPSAEDIAPVSAVVAGIAFSQLRRVGFKPNCKLGKNQLVPVVIGRNAKAVNTELFIGSGGIIKVSDDFQNSYSLCVGMSYKHVGSYKDSKRSRVKELAYRAAEAATACKELSRSTRKADVSPVKHWMLTTSLCVSRLLFDAHTFSFWTDSQLKRVVSAYEGFARRAVSKKLFDEDNRQQAKKALAICEALPCEDFLRFSRLLYICRLASSGPAFLLASLDVLASQPRSFVKRIQADLLWLQYGRGKAYGMPHPVESLSDVIQWIVDSPARWWKLVHLSKAATTSFVSFRAFGECWSRKLLSECDRCGFPGARLNGVSSPDGEEAWYKCWCGSKAPVFSKVVIHAT